MLTLKQFSNLQQAYDFFNKRLFEGALPELLISFQKQKENVGGTYCANRLSQRKIKKGDKEKDIPEIELNPNSFRQKDDVRILSVLAHEMAHHWQHCFGQPCRGYHNWEYANKMEEIGLMTSNTGEPNGKRIGHQMDHYVIAGGRFERACKDFLAKNSKVIFVEGSFAAAMSRAGVASRKSKTKFTCPDCKQNAWAKPDAKLICGECNMDMESNS